MVGGAPVSWRKVPVAVYLEIDEAGGVTPQAVEWDDGRLFEIDRLLEVTRAVSERVGGFGIRYTVRIREKEAHLYDQHDRWFMEGRAGPRAES